MRTVVVCGNPKVASRTLTATTTTALDAHAERWTPPPRATASAGQEMLPAR